MALVGCYSHVRQRSLSDFLALGFLTARAWVQVLQRLLEVTSLQSMGRSLATSKVSYNMSQFKPCQHTCRRVRVLGSEQAWAE